jgi:hypothetical protein
MRAQGSQTLANIALTLSLCQHRGQVLVKAVFVADPEHDAIFFFLLEILTWIHTALIQDTARCTLT